MRAAFGSSPTIGSSTTITSGAVHEGAGDDQLLAHAVAVALHQFVAPLLEVEQRQQLAGAVLHLGALLVVEAGHEPQELGAGELLVDERAVGNEPQLHLGGDRVGARCRRRRSRTVPPVGRRMPAIMRSVVVLPAPFGPRNPNSSPARHVEVDGVTAVKLP